MVKWCLTYQLLVKWWVSDCSWDDEQDLILHQVLEWYVRHKTANIFLNNIENRYYKPEFMPSQFSKNHETRPEANLAPRFRAWIRPIRVPRFFIWISIWFSFASACSLWYDSSVDPSLTMIYSRMNSVDFSWKFILVEIEVILLEFHGPFTDRSL